MPAGPAGKRAFRGRRCPAGRHVGTAPATPRPGACPAGRHVGTAFAPPRSGTFPTAEHRRVDARDQAFQRRRAAEHPRGLVVAAETGEGVGVEVVVLEAVHRHRVRPDAVADEAGPARLLGVEHLCAAPCLDVQSELRRAGLVCLRAHDPAVLVEGHPVAARRVDVVVHVQGQQRARRGGSVGRTARLCDDPADDLPVVVPVEIAHPHEVEDREPGLADVRRLARAAPAHLPVEDGAPGEARHHQVDDLRAVEAGVEHVHADQDLRELLLLEAPDDGAGVRGGAAAHVADDEIGVARRGMRLQVREMDVEHRRQGLGMAPGHREDDGLAAAREAADAVPAREAAVEHLAELAHDGAVALRDRELPLQRPGVHHDAAGRPEQLIELRPRGFVHRRPVELVAPDLEAALGRGLHCHRPVDAVGRQPAFGDRLRQPVAEGRRVELEEAQRVAHEAPILGVGRLAGARGAGRRGQAQLDAVEMPQHAAPLAVDRAVAFVGDHQVEIAGGERAVLGDHGLQGGDGDALGAVEAAARAQHVAGVVAEMVGEGVLGLCGQRDPVHQEEDAGDRAGLEQALDEGCRGTGLAGPRRHLHQELAPSPRHLRRERLDAVDLVAAVRNLAVDRDVGQRASYRSRGDPAFQIVLGVEGRDLAGVGVPVAVQEAHLLAVREEDEGDIEPRRVMDALVLRGEWPGARALGLDDGHGPPGAAAEHVVGARAVRQRMFEQDSHAVGQIPSGVREQGVDPDTGECFRGAGGHRSATSGPWRGVSGVGALSGCPCRAVRLGTGAGFARSFRSAEDDDLPGWRLTRIVAQGHPNANAILPAWTGVHAAGRISLCARDLRPRDRRRVAVPERALHRLHHGVPASGLRQSRSPVAPASGGPALEPGSPATRQPSARRLLPPPERAGIAARIAGASRLPGSREVPHRAGHANRGA